MFLSEFLHPISHIEAFDLQLNGTGCLVEPGLSHLCTIWKMTHAAQNAMRRLKQTPIELLIYNRRNKLLEKSLFNLTFRSFVLLQLKHAVSNFTANLGKIIKYSINLFFTRIFPWENIKRIGPSYTPTPSYKGAYLNWGSVWKYCCSNVCKLTNTNPSNGPWHLIIQKVHELFAATSAAGHDTTINVAIAIAFFAVVTWHE